MSSPQKSSNHSVPIGLLFSTSLSLGLESRPALIETLSLDAASQLYSLDASTAPLLFRSCERRLLELCLLFSTPFGLVGLL